MIGVLIVVVWCLRIVCFSVFLYTYVNIWIIYFSYLKSLPFRAFGLA